MSALRLASRAVKRAELADTSATAAKVAIIKTTTSISINVNPADLRSDK